MVAEVARGLRGTSGKAGILLFVLFSCLVVGVLERGGGRVSWI